MANPLSERGTPESAWDDLVISILAVNQYSLERTYPLLGGLRGQELTKPSVLARRDVDNIEERLRMSGFDRGAFMTRLFAQRLAAIGSLIRTKGVTECELIFKSGDRTAIRELLQPVKGVGPIVLRNFFILRDI